MIGLIVATVVDFAPTPERAAAHVFYTVSGKPVEIERTNVVGRFATVLARNGMMEGQPDRVPILLERFSFGWQPLESMNFAYRYGSRGLSSRDLRRLQAGMPESDAERPGSCDERDFDEGPRADVEALRRMALGPLVPGVAVAGRFAITRWYGAGGGEYLSEKRAGVWKSLGGGGGPLDAERLRAFGVPRSDWCRLRVYSERCSKCSSARSASRRRGR